MQQRPDHIFECPQCGNRTSTPLRPIEVVCAKTDRHKSKATVAMKEVTGASTGD